MGTEKEILTQTFTNASVQIFIHCTVALWIITLLEMLGKEVNLYNGNNKTLLKNSNVYKQLMEDSLALIRLEEVFD